MCTVKKIIKMIKKYTLAQLNFLRLFNIKKYSILLLYYIWNKSKSVRNMITQDNITKQHIVWINVT